MSLGSHLDGRKGRPCSVQHFGSVHRLAKDSRNHCSLVVNPHQQPSSRSPTSTAPLTEAAVSPAPFKTICRLISRYICSYECILLTFFLRRMRCFVSAQYSVSFMMRTVLPFPRSST